MVRSLNIFGSKSFDVLGCWDHSEVKVGGHGPGKTRAKAGGGKNSGF